MPQTAPATDGTEDTDAQPIARNVARWKRVLAVFMGMSFLVRG
jgi:hypothetical protein